MNLLQSSTAIYTTRSKLSTSIQDQPITIIKIYTSIIAFQIVLAMTSHLVLMYVWMSILAILAIYTYQSWAKTPEYTVWGYDFRQTFYTIRDNPTKKQGEYIHRLAEVLFVCMGLQREAGLIDNRYKYSNKAFIGLLMPLAALSALIAQINALAFHSTTLIAVNVREFSNFQLWFMDVYTYVSVFGLFLVMFGGPLWIYYQLTVMRDYWDWKQNLK